MGPTIKSVAFDKESYEPGETVTATVTYTPGSPPVTFDVTVKVTVGGQAAETWASFTVDQPAVTMTDSGDHAWTQVSTDGTTAVFTTVLPNAATTTPPPVFSGSTNQFTWPQAGSTNGFRVQASGFDMPPEATIEVAGSSYHQWSATLNVPSRTTGSVAAFPNVSTWDQIPGPSGYVNTPNPLFIKQLTQLAASWSHTMPEQMGPNPNSGSYTPQGYQAEAAFDVFVRPPAELTAETDHHEVMLWTTLQTRLYKYLSQFFELPAIDGVVWQGWATSASIEAGKPPKLSTAKWELILIPTTSSGSPLWRPSGDVTLLAVFNALVAVTWLSPTDELSFVQYGFEVNTTRGVPLTFGVDDYSLELAFSS